MKRPKVHRSKAKIISGPKSAPLVSKIRRTSKEAYGTRSEWQTTCAAVKKRDGYKCTMCGRPEHEQGLTVDHIVEVSRGGQTAMHNLRTLCFTCHANRPSHKRAKKLILSGAKK